ncbi:hypothetical protein [Roseibium sp. LAB1]
MYYPALQPNDVNRGAEHKKTPTRRCLPATDRGAIAVRLNDCRYFDIRIAEEKILVNRRKAQRSATHKISPPIEPKAIAPKRTNFANFATSETTHQNRLFLLKRMANFSSIQATISPNLAMWQHKITLREIT